MAAASSSSATGDGGAGKGEIMLFGVRVVVDPMRKCVSLNNLSDYEKSSSSPVDEEIPRIVGDGGDDNKNETDVIVSAAAGYASANEAVVPVSSRERKRGVPWTESEHKRFLLGLQKVGKGDWKGISRSFVKSRTPTQVASHAQKYFLRRTNLNRRRRRSSLFDITTETVTEMPMEQDQDNTSVAETKLNSGQQVMQVFPPVLTRTENAPQQTFHYNDSSSHLVPVTFQAKPEFNLNVDAAASPAPLSLNLSLASSFEQSRHPAFAMMPSFSDGDSNSSSSIRVA